MVMLGDETWLKLFPDLFTRYDGVSSFYVRDTTEVDYNVSRHLKHELETDDWKLMILHYLGLDHIGHIGGRYSPLMAPKLKEMDEVIEQIHKSTVIQNGKVLNTLLVIVSDHGMNDNGNHGGSSYQETDSLVLFIGLRNKLSDYVSAVSNYASQVDVASTIALLFGVPIPKNSVGMLMSRVFELSQGELLLRALELNTWQLLRLLEVEFPGLLCGNWTCHGFNNAYLTQEKKYLYSSSERFYCLFSNAASLHNEWKSHKASRSNVSHDSEAVVTAYTDFLWEASEWLSKRTTYKPVHILALGLIFMFVSLVVLLSLFYQIHGKVYHIGEKHILGENENRNWRLEEVFILVAVIIHLISLGSSSLVEEEQYVWHFLTSTIYLIFLRKTCQRVKKGRSYIKFSSLRTLLGRSHDNYIEMCSIFIVLICGRFLRAWYQGGVNWTSLPDISKWLRHSGSLWIKPFQITALFLVISSNHFIGHLEWSSIRHFHVPQFSIYIPGFLILLQIMERDDDIPYIGSSVAQIIYLTIGIIVLLTVVASPWCVSDSITINSGDLLLERFPLDVGHSMYLIGRMCTVCWGLLQLFVQQPINAVPISVLLLQILANTLYFSNNSSHYKQWVEVACFYFLGMAGHFGLGNSNTLATIDVAGAFIGISSHSTVLAGILLFIITHASPPLFLFGLMISTPSKVMKSTSRTQIKDLGFVLESLIGLPCLVPLCLNSVILIVFTIVLLLMRNHLFVWSVFSPKYLYVCCMTATICIGVLIIAVIGSYSWFVIFFKMKLLKYFCPNHR